MPFDSNEDRRRFFQGLRQIRPDIARSLLEMKPDQRNEWVDFIRTAAKEGNPFAVRLISQLTLARISE